MRDHRRPRLSYANVMASIAVFLVLGGGAYAASTLPKNSIGSKQLKNGSITAAKLSASAKRALKGATGPQGIPGPQGAPGATKVIVRSGPFANGDSTASCQPGEVATGGGGIVNPAEAESWIWNTTPVQLNGQVPTAWEASAENKVGNPSLVQAYVICAAP
jgi:hypothetical protein